MLRKLSLHRWLDEAKLETPLPPAFLEALALIERDCYSQAADTLLQLLRQPLPTALVFIIQLHAAQCLIRGLIHGQFDHRVTTSPMSALTQSNWVLDQAEHLLLAFLSLSPTPCLSVFLDLATVQRMQGRYRPALDSLQQALNLSHDSAEVHFEYAQICVILGLLETAADHFRQAHEAAPYDMMIAKHYILSLLRQGAKELAMTVIADTHSYAQTHFLLSAEGTLH